MSPYLYTVVGNFDTYLTQSASKYNVPELRDTASVLVSVTDLSPGSVGGVGGGGDSNNNKGGSGWKITAIIFGEFVLIYFYLIIVNYFVCLIIL